MAILSKSFLKSKYQERILQSKVCIFLVTYIHLRLQIHKYISFYNDNIFGKGHRYIYHSLDREMVLTQMFLLSSLSPVSSHITKILVCHI